MTSLSSTKHNENIKSPILVPLGDCGLLVRFGSALDSDINEVAVRSARVLADAQLDGALEICPSLVSVFIRYDPIQTSFMGLCQNVRMALTYAHSNLFLSPQTHHIEIAYGGDEGPDLSAVAQKLGMGIDAFIEAHNQSNLRVLAVGFAPGFTYFGLHGKNMNVPRRTDLHTKMPPGSILFAAGQTAITASYVPTGWNVIGRSKFQNFDETSSPPTLLHAGDKIVFSGTLV